MTEQDNLRDRIAESQRRVLKRRALIVDVDLPAYLAQAIIDELGLTVENDVVFHKVTQEGMGTKSDPQTRVVGKWEKQ